ncbi:16S rRNA (guanine(966)-N(2))-methyltransferase RsmD [Nocardia sp. 348MFTsu5.1]|uniref:16S rRNA (guanine(966)-N(2))-methyltransferase RsmD n=1 Tax=Nocardia sp. 348MFTsu5.1 TaxID=1172185 RepID=UPI00037D49DE|nr:16S rRNA (guanine(966)-N(2))-methyltransferase RsmD [Nocardia sp. 348MFTsu5.1]
MTRIIAGSARGRRLAVPAAGTRPTTDQVRESVFNILTNRIDFSGLVVFDLFAGSGALGLEALSRGAGSAILVESDAKAAKVIGGNITSSGLSGARLVRRRVADYLRGGAPVADLVFADPPYDLPGEQVDEMLTLLSGGALAPGGMVVLERSVRSAATGWPDAFGEPEIRKYGETRVEMAELG